MKAADPEDSSAAVARARIADRMFLLKGRWYEQRLS